MRNHNLTSAANAPLLIGAAVKKTCDHRPAVAPCAGPAQGVQIVHTRWRSAQISLRWNG